MCKFGFTKSLVTKVDRKAIFEAIWSRELRFGEAEKCVPEKCEMRLTETTFALVRFSS